MEAMQKRTNVTNKSVLHSAGNCHRKQSRSTARVQWLKEETRYRKVVSSDAGMAISLLLSLHCLHKKPEINERNLSRLGIALFPEKTEREDLLFYCFGKQKQRMESKMNERKDGKGKQKQFERKGLMNKGGKRKERSPAVQPDSGNF